MIDLLQPHQNTQELTDYRNHLPMPFAMCLPHQASWFCTYNRSIGGSGLTLIDSFFERKVKWIMRRKPDYALDALQRPCSAFPSHKHVEIHKNRNLIQGSSNLAYKDWRRHQVVQNILHPHTSTENSSLSLAFPL